MSSTRGRSISLRCTFRFIVVRCGQARCPERSEGERSSVPSSARRIAKSQHESGYRLSHSRALKTPQANRSYARYEYEVDLNAPTSSSGSGARGGQPRQLRLNVILVNESPPA